MTIIITGAAGFIGANLVKALNQRGEKNIIAVDNFARADKFANLVDCDFADYFDKRDFLDLVKRDGLPKNIGAVLHQGACSDTMETDGAYMMQNNYRYSVALLEYCLQRKIPFIYASSASVYGSGKIFSESRANEAPLNIYGYSKFLFDQYVRRALPGAESQITGFRYFNVYGPRESHKGPMASVAWHFFNQYRADGKVKLFEGSSGYADGEQIRDFVSVEDVVKVNCHFLDKPKLSGIFNLGTGRGQTYNDMALATINACREGKGEATMNLTEAKSKGMIEYVPFPAALKGKYQSYTQADLAALRKTGYAAPFLSVEQGVSSYISALLDSGRA
ncbi:MAG: ADP-glyceromanno-heptose 6-epimerase [Burkholderiales bacterium]